MRSIIKNGIIFVLTFILILILFEIFLRLVLPQNTCAVDFDNNLKIFKFVPNSKCTWYGYTGEFEVPVIFNNQGYRDYSHSLIKAKEITRIAVIGDSIVEALQVPLNKTFVKLLEKQLNQNNRTYEVLNFGISGIGTEFENLLLKKEILKYSPDIVILAFTVGNDVRDNILTDLNNMHVPNQKIFGIEYTPLKNFLRTYFHVFAFFADNIRLLITKFKNLNTVTEFGKNVHNYDFEIYLNNYSETTEEGWTETKNALLEMNNSTKSFIVFIVPTAFQVDTGKYETIKEEFGNQEYNITKPINILVSFCNKNDIPVINPLKEFRENNLNNSFYWEYDGHFNEKGHALAAQIIYTFLRNEVLK